MESSKGTSAVALDFLQPHLSGKVNGFFKSSADAGRRLVEEQTKGGAEEQIALTFFGGGKLGQDAILPCLVPQLCEDTLYNDKFGSSVVNILVSILDFPIPSWLFWVIDIPDVTVEIREDMTRLMAATVKGTTFDNNNRDRVAVSTAVTMVNPSHLYETVKPIIEPSRWPDLPLPKYSIQPAKDFNFLSFALSGIFIEIDMAEQLGKERKVSSNQHAFPPPSAFAHLPCSLASSSLRGEEPFARARTSPSRT
jgi:hypothetical protein